MNTELVEYLVSPVTHKKLFVTNEFLTTQAKEESYPVVNGVPVLLPPDMVAYWHRELIEVLLWQYPEVIEKLYSEVNWKKSPVSKYHKYLKKTLKDKNGILAAFEAYSNADKLKWIPAAAETVFNIPAETVEKFFKYSNYNNGKERVEIARKLGTDGWAYHLDYYTDLITKSKPKTIFELATGAGFGTSAVADKKAEDCLLFTTDVDFCCLGNAAGIAEYLNIEDTLCPVDSNFWYLPVADSTIDVVCTHYGLDESRENERTISEVARILKAGGRFICCARNNPFDRQGKILAKFEFTDDEADALLEKAGLYSGTDNLIKQCGLHGLKLESLQEFNKKGSHARTVTAFLKV